MYMNIIVCMCMQGCFSVSLCVGRYENVLVHKIINSSSFFSPHTYRKTDIKPTITYSSHKFSWKILTVACWSVESGLILKSYNYTHGYAKEIA